MRTLSVAALCLTHFCITMNSKYISELISTNPGPQSGYIPSKDKINCTGLDWTIYVLGCNYKYTICREDDAWEFECMPELYYDAFARQCSVKEKVKECANPELFHGVLLKSPVEFICTHKEDGAYAEPGEPCTQRYFRCNHGQTEIHKCRYGHYYDSSDSTNHRCLRKNTSELCEEGRR